jgi:hypothetical protein
MSAGTDSCSKCRSESILSGLDSLLDLRIVDVVCVVVDVPEARSTMTTAIWVASPFNYFDRNASYDSPEVVGSAARRGP